MKNALCVMSDATYAKISVVMLKSFVVNNPTFNGDIVILDIGLTEDTRLLFKDFRNIKFHIVDKNNFKALGGILSYEKICQMKHYTAPGNLRTFKLEVFKLNYDTVLFLDSDMIIDNCIMELFDLNKSASVFVDYTDNKDMLNSGMMLLKKELLTIEVFDKLIFKLLDIDRSGEEKLIHDNFGDKFIKLDNTYNDILILENSKIKHFLKSTGTDFMKSKLWKYYEELNIN